MTYAQTLSPIQKSMLNMRETQQEGYECRDSNCLRLCERKQKLSKTTITTLSDRRVIVAGVKVLKQPLFDHLRDLRFVQYYYKERVVPDHICSSFVILIPVKICLTDAGVLGVNICNECKITNVISPKKTRLNY